MGETGPDKPGRLFKGSGVLIRVLRKFMGTRIRVQGVENVPSAPTLFVVNHFTRFETFIMPWVLWEYARKPVRSLAFKDLFAGPLGKFITRLGAVSTTSPLRNKAIISDLMKGSWSWLIYPEGVMLKNKDIMSRGRIALNVDDKSRRIPPHTGAAVLALKALFIRDDFKDKARRADGAGLTIHETLYDVKTAGDLAAEDPVMVPVNLTYYPIRPRGNALLHLAQRLMRDLPTRLEEELTIEGNLLLGGDIDVTIGPPTPVRKFVSARLPSLPRLRVLPSETRIDLATRLLARPLTDNLMAWIYQSVTVNIDHLFALALYRLKRTHFSLTHLKGTIWEVSQVARAMGLRLHPTLAENDLDRLLALEDTPAFVDVFLLAASEGVLVMEGGRWRIRPGVLHKSAPFHKERLVGTLRVIAHEVEPLGPLVRAIDRSINRSSPARRRFLFDAMYKKEMAAFESRWGLTFRVGESKPKEVGAPYFLDAKGKTGVVLIHGYKASPGEVRELARALQAKGHPVFAVRLDGHGTTPEDLATATLETWCHAVDRGIALMAQRTPRVVLGGFSMGGLLALLTASRKRGRLAGVFAVNAALRLQDFKTRLVPAWVWWNRLLKGVHLEKARTEYVVSPADYPDTNYDRHPLVAVGQLKRAMAASEKALTQVYVPTLVVQATKDPVVNPKGALRIFRRIPANPKEIIHLDLDHHVIIRGPGLAQVMPGLLEFLKACSAPLPQGSLAPLK